jgi:hypothetical protein
MLTTLTSAGDRPFGLGGATATPGVATVAVRITVVPPRWALPSTIMLEHPVNALARKLSAAVMIPKTANVVTNPGRA